MVHILTEDQLITKVIKHIIKEKGNIYFKQEGDNFRIYNKPTKNTITLELEYSFEYWKENLREFLNDNWIQDIEEYKKENPNATQEEIDLKNDELEKEFEERLNDINELKWYLEEAIQNIPVWDIDSEKRISV